MAVFSGNGSAASPSFTFSSDTDTGLFLASSGVVGIASNGLNAARFGGGNMTLEGNSPRISLIRANGAVSPFGSLDFLTNEGTTRWQLGCGRSTTSDFEINEGESTSNKILLTKTGSYLRLSPTTGGIQFNGDTLAANALDDYEEGSFTPDFLNSAGAPISTTSVDCKYIKIGSQVTCWGKIVTASGVSGSVDPYVVVRGLPKAVGTTSPTPQPHGFGSASQTITGGLDRKPMFVRAQTAFSKNDAFLYRGETNFTGGTNFEFVVTYRTID